MILLEREELDELLVVVEEIEALLQNVDKMNSLEGVKDVLEITMTKVNNSLYASNEIDPFAADNTFDEIESSKDITEVVRSIIPIWKRSIERRRGINIDREFWSIYEYFKYVDRDTIVSNTLELFKSYSDEHKRQFIDLPNHYPFLKGKLDIEADDYSLIEIYTDMMKEEVEDFKWFYDILEDYKSKTLLVRIIRYMFTFDVDSLSPLLENIYCDYYDLDILKPSDVDVFVDCGAFIGDSIHNYYHVYGNTKCSKIYAYEVDDRHIEKMKEILADYDNIIIRKKGVWSERKELYLDVKTGGAGTRLVSDGLKGVEVVPLDEDINEPISIIKMDIEGAETDALIGSRNHIINEKPKLLICTYHRPADIFTIPKLIYEMRSDYKFYLRYNGRGIWPSDYVLFAV